MFKKLFLSDLIVNASATKRTVYIALFAAFSVVTEFRGDKFFQVEAFPEYLSKGVILILLREKVFELFSEPLNVALVPWLVCQVVVKVKVQSLTSCDDVL